MHLYFRYAKESICICMWVYKICIWSKSAQNRTFGQVYLFLIDSVHKSFTSITQSLGLASIQRLQVSMSKDTHLEQYRAAKDTVSARLATADRVSASPRQWCVRFDWAHEPTSASVGRCSDPPGTGWPPHRLVLQLPPSADWRQQAGGLRADPKTKKRKTLKQGRTKEDTRHWGRWRG